MLFHHFLQTPNISLSILRNNFGQKNEKRTKKEKEQIDIPSIMRELGEKLKRASTNSWTEVDYFHEDEFSIRDFGKWVIPRGAPRDEEDYDWKERSDHSRERFLWMQESKIYHD